MTYQSETEALLRASLHHTRPQRPEHTNRSTK